MSSSRAPRIAVVGSNNFDLVTYVARMPKPGETVEAPRFEMGHGGKGANQAIAAAKLGAEVTFVTAIGDDMFGERQLQNLAANGIDAANVKRVGGVPSGIATILVEESGENVILIVKGANDELTPDDVERAGEALKRCDMILLQLEIPLETVYAAIRFGKRHGVPVVLNPAPANSALDIAEVRDVAFFMPNETELASLTGQPTGTEAEIEAAARGLLGHGMKAVIVTMGARGALLATAEGVKRIASVAVTPIDTTGAGDAFVASFARFHAGGEGLEAALERAARYAADTVTRRGAQKAYASAAEFADFERRLGVACTS